MDISFGRRGVSEGEIGEGGIAVLRRQQLSYITATQPAGHQILSCVGRVLITSGGIKYSLMNIHQYSFSGVVQSLPFLSLSLSLLFLKLKIKNGLLFHAYKWWSLILIIGIVFEVYYLVFYHVVIFIHVFM